MKTQSLKNEFVRQMQEKIFSGELKIGERLRPERELAVDMGISRSLVNSGLLELQSQGFIEMIPRQGSIVADYKRHGNLQILAALMNYNSNHIDYPLFLNMMDLRMLIECESARLAAGRITRDELNTLELLIECIRLSSDPMDAVEPMVRFHYALIQASGNTVYAMTFKSFEPVVMELVRTHFKTIPEMPKTLRLLESLYKALSAGDPEKSAQSMRACLNHGISILRKQYKP